MHVLIVGGRGQLGRAMQAELAQQKQPDSRVTVWNRPEHDLSDPQIADQLATLRPDLVINAAAWTNVDSAEAHPEAANAANALGPRYLAQGCAQCGATLVQVSTNEVFAGALGTFYREYDEPNPSSAYARSKLAGEHNVRQLLEHLYIVRVSWQFGPHGANFPSKIMAAAQKHGALRVVCDEFGNPTYAPDAAHAIWQLVQTGRYGIYHLTNAGYTSRYEFARAVLHACGRQDVPVTPIAATEWPRATLPPPHAVLVNERAAALGITLRPWSETIGEWAQQECGHRGTIQTQLAAVHAEETDL
ncbi:MAG: dTDP-4-dehydrorhamnose reductase [Caldilineaceae bacterium]|nr:dTDP-4-dehydrorhamnose reductase [Caldilineaceae bacterium]